MMEQRMLPNRFELISVRTYTAGESPLKTLCRRFLLSAMDAVRRRKPMLRLSEACLFPNRNRPCDVSYCCRCGRPVRGHRAEQHHDLPQRRHAEESYPRTRFPAPPVKMTGIGNSHLTIMATPEAHAWFDQALSPAPRFWDYEPAHAFEQGLRGGSAVRRRSIGSVAQAVPLPARVLQPALHAGSDWLFVPTGSVRAATPVPAVLAPSARRSSTSPQQGQPVLPAAPQPTSTPNPSTYLHASPRGSYCSAHPSSLCSNEPMKVDP